MRQQKGPPVGSLAAPSGVLDCIARGCTQRCTRRSGFERGSERPPNAGPSIQNCSSSAHCAGNPGGVVLARGAGVCPRPRMGEVMAPAADVGCGSGVRFGWRCSGHRAFKVPAKLQNSLPALAAPHCALALRRGLLCWTPATLAPPMLRVYRARLGALEPSVSVRGSAPLVPCVPGRLCLCTARPRRTQPWRGLRVPFFGPHMRFAHSSSGPLKRAAAAAPCGGAVTVFGAAPRPWLRAGAGGASSGGEEMRKTTCYLLVVDGEEPEPGLQDQETGNACISCLCTTVR